jgi:hypothetical protein
MSSSKLPSSLSRTTLVDLVDIAGDAEGRHPHHLVLPVVHLESQERREGTVEQAEGVRKTDLPGEPDLAPSSHAEACGGPFADAIDGQDRGFVVRRAEEGAGRVRQVMLAEQDLLGRDAESFLDQLLDPELVAEPGDHRFAEQWVRARNLLKAREQQPLELDERLLEEHYIIEIARRELARSQAELDRIARELVVVFLPREPLFFGRGEHLPIPQQRGRGVVEEAGDPENIHRDSVLAPRALETCSQRILSLRIRAVAPAPSARRLDR